MSNLNDNVTAFKAAITAVLAAATALWGWFGWLVVAWVSCMTIDYITGYSAALKNGEWNSTVAHAGLWKKAGCICAVSVAGILDAVMGYLVSGVGGLPFDYTVLLSPLVVAWYLLMEIGSILENVGKLGAPLPDFLYKAIAVLKNATESAGNAGIPEEKDKK